jgi:hypothetical protein
MTVIAVDRDSVALTLTIVSEYGASVERVWQVGPTPDSWNDGGAGRITPRPSSTTI